MPQETPVKQTYTFKLPPNSLAKEPGTVTLYRRFDESPELTRVDANDPADGTVLIGDIRIVDLREILRVFDEKMKGWKP